MKAPSSHRGATLFLQAVIILVAIASLALMLWEPHLEGRNAHATTFEIYFHDPFLAYAYLSSIVYFVGLYKAFQLLGYIGQGNAVSIESVRALRTIKYCAIAIVVLVAGALAYIFIAVRGKDDIAGGVAIGVGMIFISIVIAAAAGMFERRLAHHTRALSAS